MVCNSAVKGKVMAMSLFNSSMSSRLPSEDRYSELYLMAPGGVNSGAIMNGSTAHCGPDVSGLPCSQLRYGLLCFLLSRRLRCLL